MQGTIRTWNTLRGFGFIRPTEGDRDIFAHVSDFRGVTPVTGQKVYFDTKPARDPAHGQIACNIRIADASAKPAQGKSEGAALLESVFGVQTK